MTFRSVENLERTLVRIDAFLARRPALRDALDHRIGYALNPPGGIVVLPPDDAHAVRIVATAFDRKSSVAAAVTHGGVLSSGYARSQRRREIPDDAEEEFRTAILGHEPTPHLAEMAMWDMQAVPKVWPLRGADLVRERRAIDAYLLTEPDSDVLRIWVQRRAGEDGQAGIVMRALSNARHRLIARRAVEALIEAMPQERIDIVRSIMPPRSSYGAYALRTLLSVQFLERPEWQLQALKRAPFLSFHYRHLIDGGIVGSNGRIGAAVVAKGRPPLEAVDAMLRRYAFDVDPGVRGVPFLRPIVLRSLASLNAELPQWNRSLGIMVQGSPLDHDGTMRPEHPLVETVHSFHALHPRHRPLNAEETALAMTLSEQLEEWMHAAPETSGRALACLKDAGDRFVEPPKHLNDVLGSVGRSVKSLLSALHPGLHRDLAGMIASAILARAAFPSGRTHSGLKRFVTAWHHGIGNHEAELSALQDAVVARLSGTLASDSFPHLMVASTVIDDVQVIPLATSASFILEGKDMDHCVASYRHRARVARCILVSLRCGEGRSTAALEIQDAIVMVTEHRGFRNSLPLARHLTALGRLLADPPWNVDDVRRLAEIRDRSGGDSPEEGRLYPSMTGAERRGYLDLHFANVAIGLHRRERALGPEAWIAEIVDSEKPRMLDLLHRAHAGDHPAFDQDEVRPR